MRICVISHSGLRKALIQEGHEVFFLYPPAGLCDLEQVLKRESFCPDLIIQAENLGGRVVLQGLDSSFFSSTIKIFWSLDTHLNAWWTALYGRLFDTVLTTQQHLIEQLKRMGLPDARLLGWTGVNRPFVPWADRDIPLCFVGRLTESRPVRKWFVEHLTDQFGMRTESSVSFREMLALYDRSKFLPNEAIFGEINMRLFEGASCGSLVLTPEFGDSLGEVFIPGRECLAFNHVLELDSLLRYCMRRPEKAEEMAHRAWERVQREHLIEHRTASLMAMVGESTTNAATGRDAAMYLLASIAELYMGGLLPLPDEYLPELEHMLHTSAATPLVHTELLRLRYFRLAQDRAVVTELIETQVTEHLACGHHVDDVLFNLTASMAALKIGNFALAKTVLLRFAKELKEIPATPEALLLCWARIMKKKGTVIRPGFRYNGGVHLPSCAVDCLFELQNSEAHGLEVAGLLDKWLAPYKGTEAVRLGLLSHLSLHDRSDWRLNAQAAITNLSCFRLDAAKEELVLALENAEAQGRERMLRRMFEAEAGCGVESLLRHPV